MSVHAATGSHEVVSDHQRLFFNAYGYVILPRLFARDIDEITEAFQQVFDDPANPRLDINVIGHRFHSHYAMGTFVELHPRLTPTMSDPRLVSAARALLAPT